MEKNKIIIIALVAAIAVLCISIGYLMLNSVQYETINISNGTTIDVPKAADASWTKDGYGIKTYSCQSKHTVMTTFNSQEDWNLVGAAGFAMARDVLMNGAANVENYNGHQIKENTVNGTQYYIVFISNNTTHDNIVIGSDNLDIVKHMIDSLVLGPPGEGQVNATLQSSQTSTPTQTSDDDDENKYSEDDLMLAAQEGYYTGYSDGYDDSYNYNDYYEDYDYDDYDYYESSSIDEGSAESSDGNLE